MQHFLTNYYKLLSSLSLAMDFSTNGLMRHHQRVALISLQIGKLYGLNIYQQEKLFTAAILHDAGSSSWNEKDLLFDFFTTGTFKHCKKGYELFKNHSLFKSIADIVLYHHDRWDGRNNASGLKREEIPIESRIIHLSDRIDVLIREDIYILEQKEYICRQINQEKNKIFDPQLVEAFNDISNRECFWLDLHSPFLNEILSHHCPVITKELGLAEVLSVADTMSKVIDFKSPFTRRHSSGVANVASFLALKAGFSAEQCDIIKVAGLLHDLGKLGIPDSVLDKPGKLTKSEFNIMKRHTYYTYHILKMIDKFDTINHYASSHHETLSGRGYPFKLDGSDLENGARIVAVADIFSALTEIRPYRQAMEKAKVINILSNQVKAGAIDSELTSLLLANYEGAHILNEIS
ncbi:metal dependent phosphohydrolase [Desulforamulus reducens MI-1]|uniref:Metal dependent phosphohydrolase n=1 Tax=Desulforamulus reducens (strain ATCC BAA-1160 / DSM 100696 / MI-1) TaxID=349161 RepID=A4J0F8_DESRM|nr:HD domain-containing phosphohydrolase [Desulforamulus reducens]ABO48561.1 metal dependent phosphohydrolase [Desulforamulus reducens MI-1]